MANRDLHEDFDALIDHVVLQGADHLQAGAIADVGQARIAVPSEVALKYAAVGSAIEQGAPGLEFVDSSRCFLCVKLGHAPVIEILPAAHGVGEVNLPAIAVIDVRQCAAATPPSAITVWALPSSDLQMRPTFTPASAGFDCGAETRAAGTDNNYVVCMSLVLRHRFSSGLAHGSCQQALGVGDERERKRSASDNPIILPHAHRAKADIHIAEADDDQTHPGPEHVAFVRATSRRCSMTCSNGDCDMQSLSPPTKWRSEWQPNV